MAKGQPDSQLKASMKAARLKFSSPTAWPHREGGEGCLLEADLYRRPQPPCQSRHGDRQRSHLPSQ